MGITTGRNRDLGSRRDDDFVRCARCGFWCNKGRDSRARDGARSGYGISYQQAYKQTTIVNGIVTSIITTT